MFGPRERSPSATPVPELGSTKDAEMKAKRAWDGADPWTDYMTSAVDSVDDRRQSGHSDTE